MTNKTSKSCFNSKDAIFLLGMAYQTYVNFETDLLILPQEYSLVTLLYANAGVYTVAREKFGFIAESDDSIVVAFKGTETVADYESDTEIFQVPFPYAKYPCRVHRGEFCVYKSMRDYIISTLNSLSPYKKLYVTGHSLGGSLATMAALDIATNTCFKPIMYNYGATRSGNPEFACGYLRYVPEAFRVYNIHDVIPFTPCCAYPPPFTYDGIYYADTGIPYKLDFQQNSMYYNHAPCCYLVALTPLNPGYVNYLNTSSPGFLPNVNDCIFFTKMCSPS